MTCLQEFASAVAEVLIWDPRVHPRKGDVLDDDPPLVPLTVVAVWPNEQWPTTVEAERRAKSFGFDVVAGRWRGSLQQWRREMQGAIISGGT